jgi:hypothetical protein
MHRARWEAAARWRLLEEMRRGAALSPAAALRAGPLGAHGRAWASGLERGEGADSRGASGGGSISISSSQVDGPWAEAEDDGFMYEEAKQQQDQHLRPPPQCMIAGPPRGVGSRDCTDADADAGADASSSTRSSAYEAVVSEHIRKKRRFHCPISVPAVPLADASAFALASSQASSAVVAINLSATSSPDMLPAGHTATPAATMTAPHTMAGPLGASPIAVAAGARSGDRGWPGEPGCSASDAWR